MNTWIQFPDGYVYHSSLMFLSLKEGSELTMTSFLLAKGPHIVFLSKKLNQNGNFSMPMKYIRAECSAPMSSEP